ncbi:MAG: LysR family transcriptional regulator [Deltaproteobacteria bacterium]|nr:LysR family transcriptional regulator [Deltaproteobacteria bacterium]
MDAHLLPDVLVFLTVARLGSITKAAKRLNMVQSNVTARIQKLEQAAGATLLRRHARGVKLTGGGEAMLPMALRLEALLSDVACAFRGASSVREAKLRLGAIETVAAVQLPALVSEFLTKSPSVDITVQIGSSSGLIKQVQEDELDAAFVSRVPAQSTLQSEPVITDKLVLLAPERIKTRSNLLAGCRNGLKILVQRLGCSYTERLLSFLNDHGCRPERTMEIGTLEGIIGFVEAGVGIATMPESFIRALLRKRKVGLIPLPKELAIIRTFVIFSSNRDSRLVSDFVRQCRPVLKS